MTQFNLGSVSTGTLKPCDLLETFAATLNQLDKTNPLIAQALDAIANGAEESADTGSEVIDARVAAYELVGELIYNDCSDSLCDYRRTPRYNNNTEGFRSDFGDDLFLSMRERKRNLTPLTLEDLKAVHKHAAYQTPEIFESKVEV